VVKSSLTFIPAKRCTPTEIILKFVADFNITGGDKIAVGLSGFTSGACDNEAGRSITAELDEPSFLDSITPGDLKLFPHSHFRGGYREGMVQTGFQDSRLVFVVKPGVHYTNGTEVVINVDQGNYLKANCGIDRNGNGNFTLAVQAIALGKWIDYLGVKQPLVPAITNTIINESTAISGGCPLTDATLRLQPPIPKNAGELTIGFRTGCQLGPFDNITITLGGFTSGNATDKAGRDIPMGDVLIKTVVSRYDFDQASLEFKFKSEPIFNASWTEGLPEVEKPGYNESRLKLTVNKGYHFKPGVQFDIVLPKKNHILANCGTPGDFSGIKIKVNVKPDPTFPRASRDVEEIGFPHTARGSIQTIGDGCRSFLGFCNGNGRCDYCLNNCICNKGFGAESDIFDKRAKARDCKGRVCPYGPAFTNFKPKVLVNKTSLLPSGMDGYRQLPSESSVGPGGLVEQALGGRKLAECSGVGTCDYTKGVCKCPPGFGGSACDRKDCPGSKGGLDCSGHGQCLNMRQLAMSPDAMPLSNNKDGFGASGQYLLAGGVEASPRTWDSISVHGCLCDSGWAVGLGSNQTQETEYFGPDCSKRRCPSGDDPMTRMIDETNCTNVTAAGGLGVGRWGNKCHVDCSNRGLCDYKTGTCACFEGFFGANCGTPVSMTTLPKRVQRDYYNADYNTPFREAKPLY